MDYTDIESLDNEIDAIQDDLDNFFSIKELNEYISEVKTECRSNHYADMLDLSDADREEILDSFLEKVDEIASERIKEILNRSNRKKVLKNKSLIYQRNKEIFFYLLHLEILLCL